MVLLPCNCLQGWGYPVVSLMGNIIHLPHINNFMVYYREKYDFQSSSVLLFVSENWRDQIFT